MRVVRKRVSGGYCAWVDEDAGIVQIDPSVPTHGLRAVLDEVEAGLARRWEDAPHAVRYPCLIALDGGVDDAVG